MKLSREKTLHFFRANKGISFGLFTLLVCSAFVVFPNLAESIYRRLIFQSFRFVFDNTIGLLPFPILYLELIILPLLLYFYSRRFNGTTEKLLLLPSNTIGWIFTVFMWSWGFNYCCKSLVQYDTSKYLDAIDLFDFGQEISEELSSRPIQQFQLNSLDEIFLRKSIEQHIEAFGIPVIGHPKFNSIGFNGLMRRLGIAGIYIPFTGQAHGDESFLPTTSVFIKAHELSHAYGVCSEAEADFIAYLSLTEGAAPSDFRQDLWYCGKLELLRTIRYQLRLADDSLRLKLDSHISDAVMHDIIAIRENSLLYPEFFPGMQESFNDRYLKVMGVKDGVKNYDRFVDLAFAYHQKKKYAL